MRIGRFPQVLIAVALALAPLAAGQSAGQSPTFRSGVSLVTIDVSVVDADGRPVPGLTAADFDIALNGRPQPVRALAFIQAAAAMPAAQAPAPPAPVTVTPMQTAPALPADAPRRTWSNDGAPALAPGDVAPPPSAVPPAPGESRVFVILVDDLSFAPERGRALFAAARRFVDRIPLTNPVGFTTTSGVGAINPTRDRAGVKAALGAVAGAFDDPRGLGKTGPAPSAAPAGAGSTDAPLGISESVDIERGDESLLKDVIVRECYNGRAAALGNVSLAELLINDRCASDVQREARRVGALTRLTRSRQIDGIKNVIAAMKAASGIRHLVLITDGLAVSRDTQELTPVMRAAAEAGVQLSVLLEDPDLRATDEGRRGLEAGVSPQTDPGTARRRREDDRMLVNGVQTLADQVGAVFQRVVGTPDVAFDRVLALSGAIYRLGVELPAGAAPGKDVQVAVRVKTPGVTVRANRLAVPAASATVTPPAPAPGPARTISVPASVDDVLKAALNSSMPAGGVPVRMAVTVRRSASGASLVDVSVNVALPSSVPGPVTAIVGVVDASGAMRVSRRVLEPGADGYVAAYLFPLEPGDYRIRFGAAEVSGTVGTIEVPVRAVLSRAGPFTMSDVLTWYVDGADRAQLFTLDTMPAGVDVLHASLELYPAGAIPDAPVPVRWTLTAEGATTPVFDDESDARPAASLLRADIEVPMSGRPAGTYILTATVGGGTAPIATRAATIRTR